MGILALVGHPPVLQGGSNGFQFSQAVRGKRDWCCLDIQGLLLLHASLANVAATMSGKHAVAST